MTDELKMKVLGLLNGVERNGMQDLINWLMKNDYFTSPASTKYHGNYSTGLIEHSLNVYNIFTDMINKFNLELSEDSRIICSLLHDVCKVGAYIPKGSEFVWNKDQPKGHGLLSVERIEDFITLSDQERNIIMFHMGFFGSARCNRYGEYLLKDFLDIYEKDKFVRLFHFADDASTQYLEVKK